jgi:TolB-like protein/Tfp pilus assembly protein PilF
MTELKSAQERLAARPAERQPSIAVLPFANMSRDPDDEYFSDGLAEEIMNTLAHLPGLKVTARTSAFAFRGKEQDIRKIAEVLNVRTILEGSVRRSGSRIRVTAQLINAEDGYHLWSERYDREMADVFAMQDEIAAAIAAALEVKLVGKPSARRAHKPNIEAYEAFLRGRHEILKTSPASVGRAKQLFEQAIALDWTYAEPHAELGYYYLLQGLMGLSRALETMPAARALAQKALELSPADSRAHAVLCLVAGLYDYNWKEAGEQYRLAMAAENVPAEVRSRCSLNYLLPMGRMQETIEQIERAIEQDPLNVNVRGYFAAALTRVDYDRALAEAQKAVEIDASHWLPHYAIGSICASRGEFAAARPAAERCVQAAAWYAPGVGLLAGILAQLGEKERADELVTRLSDMPRGLVAYHLRCSEIDAAADCLTQMIADRDPVAPRSSSFEPELRASPRWPALAKMMNLPPEVV